jgi:hypothetical protein
MSDVCRTCKRPIVWAITATGKRIPLDPEPVKGGNLRLVDGRALAARDEPGPRFVTHFATCPFASEHRRPR